MDDRIEKEKQKYQELRDQSDFILDLTRNQTTTTTTTTTTTNNNVDNVVVVENNYNNNNNNKKNEDNDNMRTDRDEFILDLTRRQTSEFTEVTNNNTNHNNHKNHNNNNNSRNQEEKKEKRSSSSSSSKVKKKTKQASKKTTKSLDGKKKASKQQKKKKKKSAIMKNDAEEKQPQDTTSSNSNSNSSDTRKEDHDEAIVPTTDLTLGSNFTPPGAIRVNGVNNYARTGGGLDRDDDDDDDYDNITRSVQNDVVNTRRHHSRQQQRHPQQDSVPEIGLVSQDHDDNDNDLIERGEQQVIAQPIQQASPVDVHNNDDTDHGHHHPDKSESEKASMIRKMSPILLCCGLFLLITVVVVVVVLLFGGPSGDKDSGDSLPNEDEASDTGSDDMIVDNNNNNNNNTTTETPIVDSDALDSLSQRLFPLLSDFSLGTETIANIEDTTRMEDGQPTIQRRAFEHVASDPNFESYPTKRLLRRFAMTTFYYATKGDEWTVNSAWLDHSVHECDWYGIVSSNACKQNDDSAELILHLPSNNLQGRIPHEVSYLVDLVSLNLNYNSIVTMSPRAIFTLERLEQFSVHDNNIISNFGGNIDGQCAARNRCHYLYERSALREIDFSSNRLHGELPISFASLSQLMVLKVDDNPDLGGMIPEEYCQAAFLANNNNNNQVILSIAGTGIIEGSNGDDCSTLLVQP